MIEKVSLPESRSGRWAIERFTVAEPMAVARFWHGARAPRPGTYTRLMRGSTLVMSDTPAEMRDHIIAVHKAHGHCLINGLGLGMVLAAVLRKPEVSAVTVVEVSGELIEMVGPHYRDPRVTFVTADAYEYTPPKNLRFGMVWHDIWDTISVENLEGMKRLHRKYGRRAEWQGSWCRSECEWMVTHPFRRIR